MAIVMLGQSHIADRMGISPSGAKQLIDAGALPAPDAFCGDRALWTEQTFETWFCGYRAGQRSKGRRSGVSAA